MHRFGQMISLRIESRGSPRDQTVNQIQGPVKIDLRNLREAASFNQALQRTAPCVTAPASAAAFPPTMQVPRRSGASLSLRSLIWLSLLTFGKAGGPTFFVVVFMDVR